jgi:hypothetical protein
MVDNVGYTPGSGATVAAREVTYSGDTVKAQVVGLATFAGTDDAKTITDVTSDSPLPVSTGPLEWLMRQLRDLLLSPRGYDAAQNRMRQTAIIESGTIGTVSTVSNISAGTLTTLNGLGTLPAESLVRHQNIAAWQVAARSRIT